MATTGSSSTWVAPGAGGSGSPSMALGRDYPAADYVAYPRRSLTYVGHPIHLAPEAWHRGLYRPTAGPDHTGQSSGHD